MPNFKHILAAIQHREDAATVLAKLQRITPNRQPIADIKAVRVVYDGMVDSRHVVDVEKLQSYILEAERPYLNDAIDDCDVWMEHIDKHTVWHKVTWQGILQVAKDMSADLIIKQISDANKSHYLHTPEDWNLLRHSECPVLMTQSTPWSANPNVVAAIDTFDTDHRDLNIKILQNAQRIATQLHATLHIISVFPLVANWLDQVTSINSYEHLKREIEADIANEVNNLCQQEAVHEYELHAAEGLAELAIQQLVSDQQADLLIVGTNARQGIRGFVLGNTVEKILSHTTTDVLTIP